MQIKAQQLDALLKKGLSPVYLISGDEPQQAVELADQIRLSAKVQGFDIREIYFADKHFDWRLFSASAENLSLFSDKKIIDLRLHSASPGVEGTKALVRFCQRPPEDTLLLISTGKLGKESKTTWFQAIDKAGVIVQIWPLASREFLQWLEQKMKRRGIITEPELLKILANRLEGNLLAAHQEIEKLYGLYGAGNLSHQQILDAVVDSSRYDVFKLIESAMAAQIAKAMKILSALKAEGVASSLVLWALAREARILVAYNAALSQGERDNVMKIHGVWGERRRLIEQASQKLSLKELNHILVLGAKADRQIKGQQLGDPWETLLEAMLVLASVSVMRKTG